MTKTAVKETTKDSTNQKGMVFIQKVKINPDNTAKIWYKKSDDLFQEERTASGQDQVTEEFKSAFQSTVEGFCGCIPRLTGDINKITMNCIKFDYGTDGYLKQALYSVKYAFNDQNNAVINISTPLLPIYQEGMENTFCISGKHEEALHEVIRLAKAYIKGDTRTKQMKLVVDNTEEK